MRPSPRLRSWIGGTLLGSALTMVGVVLCREHYSVKWAECRQRLYELMSGAEPNSMTVDCADCDWPTMRTELPPVLLAACHDFVPMYWGWGLECNVYFGDGSYIPGRVRARRQLACCPHRPADQVVAIAKARLCVER